MKNRAILVFVATLALLAFVTCENPASSAPKKVASGSANADSSGATIEISEDGYWVINGVKTGIKVQGRDGGDFTANLHYYTVTYDANGGSGEMEDSSFAIGFLGRLAKNTFTNAGFVFSGWSTAAEGLLEYADRDVVEDLSTTANATVILYAVWGAPNTYTVSYNANGGEGAMLPSVFTLGQVYALAANIYVRTGYTFEGWALSADGPVMYANMENVHNLSAHAGEPFYLFAVWKAISYTVVYDANGGAGTMADSAFTYDDPLTPLRSVAFSRLGYLFYGWSTLPEGPMEYAGGEEVQNLCITDGAVLTLYALWRDGGSFIVIYDPDNGNPATPVVVNGGYPMEKPAVDPVKTLSSLTEPGLYRGTAPAYSCVFYGWYRGETPWDFSTVIAEDITLIAKWGSIDLSGIAATTGDTVVDKTITYVNANPADYTLLVGEDIVITGGYPLSQSNVSLTLLGLGSERKISLTSQGYMFVVGKNGETGIELTLGENITLVGFSSGNSTLINIQYGGTLTMQDNAMLIGGYSGYGVSQTIGGGYFIMKGSSKVTGNTSIGVFMDGGYFTMQDSASVTNNAGGGVQAFGFITMQDNALVSNNGSFGVQAGTMTMQGNASVSYNAGTGVNATPFAMQDSATVSYNTGFGVSSVHFTMKDNSSVSNNTDFGVRIESLDPYIDNFIMQGNATVSNNTGGGVWSNGSYTIVHFIMQSSSSVSGNGNASSIYAGGVHIERGSFIMQDDASVSNNIGQIGGVVVGISGSNSSFIMKDNATVSGNTGDFGGVMSLGSFSMHDNSSIYGNTATASYGGGGVIVRDSGTFRISGGTVYGNEAVGTDAKGVPLKNTAVYGAALTKSYTNNAAQYGTFDGTAWSGLMDIPTVYFTNYVDPDTNFFEGYIRDTTIKVENGVLVP